MGRRREQPRYVLERVADSGDLEQALDALHATDVYLACGCAAGDPHALAAFQSAMRPVAERALQRMAVAIRETSADGDDAYQTLIAKLFIAGDDAHPRIEEYLGRGDLRSWFRVAITRQALNAMRAFKREVPLDEAALAMTPCSDEDPELSHLRRRFAPEFGEAFASAVRALQSAERNLLRYHYIDGLNIDEIGAIYRVHRVTAARRLTRAREALILTTRRLLAERLRATPSELRSVMRALDGAVDPTLGGALRKTNSS